MRRCDIGTGAVTAALGEKLSQGVLGDCWWDCLKPPSLRGGGVSGTAHRTAHGTAVVTA